jgi:UDP-N-acetylmuramate dehydrogenase
MKESLFKNFRGQVFKNKDLSKVAAYKIGGKAKFFLVPDKDEDVEEILKVSNERSIPLFILGSGTNLLISDKGFEGIVLWMGPRVGEVLSKSIKVIKEDSKEIILRVPAHFSKAKLLDFSLQKKWSGLEFSAGIPGSLGGAVYMNAGTKWGSYGEIIETVDFVSASRGRFTKTAKEIGFRYRGHGEGLLDGSTLVSSVTIKLNKTTPAEKIFATVDEIYSYRGLRQPLELPNCGSVFKNPPHSEKGAGRLIEAAKLKGSRVGGAEVSLKHANFILNTGSAKAQHVYSLIQKIQNKVYAQFSLKLEPEVIFLGKF